MHQPPLFELIATFHHIRPQLKLIVLGTETGPEYIQRIIGAGAKGYLTLTARETELAMAIEMVRDGSVWAPRRVLSRLLDRQPGFSGTASTPPKFTPREMQVLELLRAGRSNREIGVALGHRREHGQGAHRPPAAQGGREQPDRADHAPLHPV
jgi:DNA-binding NarL/FixJ family response regulator